MSIVCITMVINLFFLLYTTFIYFIHFASSCLSEANKKMDKVYSYKTTTFLISPSKVTHSINYSYNLLPCISLRYIHLKGEQSSVSWFCLHKNMCRSQFFWPMLSFPLETYFHCGKMVQHQSIIAGKGIHVNQMAHDQMMMVYS